MTRQVRKRKTGLEARKSASVDLLIVAGEHSGDQHAAEILKIIKKRFPHTRAAAFGGPALKLAGADLILDMTEFAVVGLYEAMLKIFFFLKLLKQIFSWIENNRPKVVCLVDYPGFNLRLAKMLFERKISKKAGGDVQVLYYISPQIWAWKAKRRYQLAKYVDKLAAILPFEKKFFSETGLQVDFVGHPFVKDNFRLNVSYNQEGPILLLPGSRRTAVQKIFPGLLKVFRKILKNEEGRMALVLYPDEAILTVLRKILKTRFSDLVNKVTFVPDGENIEAAAAIMSSGTMSLKCCLAGIPGAIVYKTHPLTFVFGKALVHVKYIGLANILLGRCMWKEFLQNKFKTQSVTTYILECLNNKNIVDDFKSSAEELRQILSTDKDLSADQWIIEALSK